MSSHFVDHRGLYSSLYNSLLFGAALYTVTNWRLLLGLVASQPQVWRADRVAGPWGRKHGCHWVNFHQTDAELYGAPVIDVVVVFIIVVWWSIHNAAAHVMQRRLTSWHIHTHTHTHTWTSLRWHEAAVLGQRKNAPQCAYRLRDWASTIFSEFNRPKPYTALPVLALA